MSDTQASTSRAFESEDKDNDEIGLRELITTLWQGKIYIAFCIFFTTSMAISYALLANEKWVTKSSISKPQLSDYLKYQIQVSQYQPAFDIYQEDGTVLVSEALVKLLDPEELLLRFVQQFKSTRNKKSYINQQEDFQNELRSLTDLKNKERQKRPLLGLYAKWYSKLSINVQKKTLLEYSLTSYTNFPEASYNLLIGYVDYINNKSRDIALRNLHSIVLAKKVELVKQRKIFESHAKVKLDIELQLSRSALKIASSAGVDKPVENLGDKELFAIDLGANALKAKVGILSEIKNFSTMEPRIQIINSKLNILEGIDLSKNIEFDLFQFIEQPEIPISRSSPKRFLIAILGSVLGGIIVLVRTFFGKN